MTINFNQEEYKEQLKIHKRLEELKPRYEKELNIFASHSYDEVIRNGIREKEKKIKELNTFFKRRKNKAEIKLLTSQVESDKKYLEKYIKEKNEIKENIEKMKEEIDNLESKEKDIIISDAISFDNKVTVISDSDEIPLSKNVSDDKVMVHCTNFFPKDKTILCNYDGNKKWIVPFEYNGIKKEVEVLSHRHTVHFAINSVVETTAQTEIVGGVWKQPKYIIIEPFDNHKNQFVSTLSAYSDEYTYGSVKLGDKPLLLVREDSYDEIPENEIEKYHVFKYKGDYKTCVDNLIKLLGYDLIDGNANYAGHAHSDESLLEELLKKRHLIINYVLNNSYDGKSDINFQIEDISKMYNIYNDNYNENKGIFHENILPAKSFYSYISEEIRIPKDFAIFCLNFGFYKDEDRIKIYDDDKMYDLRKNYKELFKKIEYVEGRIDRDYFSLIKDNIKYDQISDVYLDYLKYQRRIIKGINDNNQIEEEQIKVRHV